MWQEAYEVEATIYTKKYLRQGVMCNTFDTCCTKVDSKIIVINLTPQEKKRDEEKERERSEMNKNINNGVHGWHC